MQHARADAFDVTGLTAGKYTRQLAIDRPAGRVTYDVPSVSATVEIGREVVERPFTRVPVAVIGHASAKAQPAEVDVRLTCPPEVVRALRPEQIVPRVEVDRAGASTARSAARGARDRSVRGARDAADGHRRW